MSASWIKPNWPVPAHVKSCVTTRLGGFSSDAYNSFNLAHHVGDNFAAVEKNRDHLQQIMGYKIAAWLEQVHGTTVVKADPSQLLIADASWTNDIDVAVAIMTADCLPVLFCDQAGQYVAAAHAGWRGLLNGVLEATIDALPVQANQLLAWLGPAIGPQKFEVGAEVREAFLAVQPNAYTAFFNSSNHGKYLANIYQLAKQRLHTKGVTHIYGGNFCTVTEDRFYSYRQRAITGRMASLIWLTQS